MNTLVFLMELNQIPHFETQEEKNKALLRACRNGNKFFVQRLLLAGANVECRDAIGDSPLTICVFHGFRDIARLLISHGANVNTVNHNGDSALSLAVGKSCSTDMVQMLLQQKSINVFYKNKEGLSSLMAAVGKLDFDLVHIILEKMFRSGDETLYKKSVFEAHCLSKNLGIEKIFQYMEQEVSQGKPALHSAVAQGDLESVKFLLDYDIVKLDNALYEAFFIETLKSYHGRESDVGDDDLTIVKEILEHGKNVLFQSVNEKATCALGVNIGNTQLVDLLCRFIIYNASVDVAESEFSLGLKACAMVCRCDLLRVLLKYKPNIVKTNTSTISVDQTLISGSIEFLNMLWDSGIKLNTRDSMITCIIHSQINSLNFILEKLSEESELIIKDSDSGIFHKAVEAGDILVIERLIQAGANVNGIFERKTPLMCCSSIRVAEVLFQHGAHISQMDDVDEVNAILNLFSPQYAAFVLQETNLLRYGFFYFHEITKESVNEYKQLVKDLLDLYFRKGGSIEEKDTTGRTVLMLASEVDEFEDLLSYLLNFGADPENKDTAGRTSLHYAVSKSCMNNVEILLSFKANVNAKSDTGRSCLHQSVTDNNQEMIKLLVSRGANVNAEDDAGNTPMALAASLQSTKPETLKCLWDSGADLNHRNQSGRTPLITAASLSHIDNIQTLCDLGADVNVRNNESTESALEIMVESCNIKPAYLRGNLIAATLALLKHGARAEFVPAKHLTGLIYNREYRLLQRLIYAGASPSELDTEESYFLTEQLSDSEIKVVSPFRFALFANRSALAKYFLKINFLTDCDTFQRDWVGIFRQVLNNCDCFDAITVLDEFYSKPMSLETMCLIKISSAVHAGEGRESRVKSLPLPAQLQNELLFHTDLTVEPEVVGDDSSSDDTDYNDDFDFNYFSDSSDDDEYHFF